MSAAAVVMMKERKLVGHFRGVGATSPATARTLADIGADEGLALRRLTRRAVIRESTPGTYYLDELSWKAHRGMRLRIMAVFLVVALAIVGLATYFGQGR